MLNSGFSFGYTHSRLICYDILDLGKQLQPIGMLVVLTNSDAVLCVGFCEFGRNIRVV